tara:strand:+ start:2893 stop:3288 length:396 start_codon:yes stop_codon:yes gene_type:complete
MAKLEYIGNELVRSLVKGGSISPSETLTIDANIALVYLGDKDFKITFDISDRATLALCSDRQYEWLQKEFGGKTLEKTLDKMFKPKTKKKSILPKIPEVKKEVIAEKPKIPEAKKEKVSPIKKKITDSELL